jgi:hypothetical protein
MSGYYGGPASAANQGYGAGASGAGAAAQNLQFYPSSYSPSVGGGAGAQGSYGYGNQGASGGYGGNPAFGAAPGVSGRMGEQGGLRTGWLAAFSTEGYDGEPSLLEELGVNFGHIQKKVFDLPPINLLPRAIDAKKLPDFGSFHDQDRYKRKIANQVLNDPIDPRRPQPLHKDRPTSHGR